MATKRGMSGHNILQEGSFKVLIVNIVDQITIT